ncbi:acyl-CoA thioesterase [Marinobacter caseinilyticus]|uniref:acyl-CoA thioesterase n=1 Tax=Marinobacter caseinilyticus TaxID=2692195 RepID=UPI00140B18D1|nr:thioesterase family protein [Marinobacter caseinilyticus]
MFQLTVEPRFNDTDALGHISNTAFPVWFEQARTPVFAIFHPALTMDDWPLILARLEVDFKAQTYWSKPVEIQTWIGHLGTASCQLVQEAWQAGKLVARAVSVLVYFDYKAERSRPIPDSIREQLSAHFQHENQ